MHASLGNGKGIMSLGEAWSKSEFLILVEGDEEGVLGEIDRRLLPPFVSPFSGVEELTGR